MTPADFLGNLKSFLDDECRPFLTHLIGVGSFFLGDEALSVFLCFELASRHIGGVGWFGLVVIHVDHELAGGNELTFACRAVAKSPWNTDGACWAYSVGHT